MLSKSLTLYCSKIFTPKFNKSNGISESYLFTLPLNTCQLNVQLQIVYAFIICSYRFLNLLHCNIQILSETKIMTEPSKMNDIYTEEEYPEDWIHFIVMDF